MRTTVDLPDDLHALARSLAHQQRRSMSDVICALIRQGLRGDTVSEPATTRRGLPVVSVGRPITADDVTALEDE